VLLFLFVQTLQALSTYVPAIDAQGNGVLTRIEVQIIDGDGDTFVSVTPLTGMDTQESEKLAVKIAAEMADVDRMQYDVLFKINSDAEVVDGPSAGAALTLLAYSEFSHQTIRKDLVVSGTIERDGRIGPVGGIFEKAVAVGKSNKYRLFLVPEGQRVQNGVDLNVYGEEQWGMQVVEVQDIEEVFNYAFNTVAGEPVVVVEKVLPPLVVPEVTPALSTLPFKSVSENILSEATTALRALPDEDATSLVRTNLRKALNLSEMLLEKGYFYSSANSAFLAMVTLDELGTLNMTRQNFRSKVRSLQDEAEALDFVEPTGSNWEWVVSAKLRYYWALERLDTLEERLVVLSPDYLLEEYALAKSWLTASKNLNDVAVSVSADAEVNELSIRPIAVDYLDEAEELRIEGKLDDEGMDHLTASRRAFQNGDYLTAAFNLQFVLRYTEALQEAGDLTYAELWEGVCGDTYSCLTSQSHASAWGSLYYDHGRYYVYEANRSDNLVLLVSALKLFKLSEGIETLYSKSKEAFTSPVSSEPSISVELPLDEGLEVSVTTAPTPGSGRDLVVFSIIALLALLGLMTLVIRGRLKKKAADPLNDFARRLERAESLLLDGKLSERNYERIRDKYAALVEEERRKRKKQFDAGQPPLVEPLTSPVRKKKGGWLDKKKRFKK